MNTRFISWNVAAALALAASTALAAPSVPAPPAAPDDPYLWLEDVTGTRALDWVHARNAESQDALAQSDAFKSLEADLRKNYDSDQRIPFVSKEGPYYYNFWQDAQHPRGLWRRTTLVEYRKAQPKWDVLIDVDAL